MTDPPESPAEHNAARLSDLPPSVRSHPLFRKGYNRGYSDRAYEDLLARRVSTENRPVIRRANYPLVFDVTAGSLRHRLAPGVGAMRDLSTLSAQRFTTETPCCGRRITIAVPVPDETQPAMCCHCRVLFAVGLLQEEPDGFGGESPHVAIFIVEQTDVAVAQHRAGRWELGSQQYDDKRR